RSVVEGSPLVRLGRTIRWRPSIGSIETGTALALLNALLLLFVALQLPAMVVGAEEVVRRTPGLTLAEYARRGFFELVAVATIVGPVLLAADQFGRRDSRRQER